MKKDIYHPFDLVKISIDNSVGQIELFVLDSIFDALLGKIPSYEFNLLQQKLNAYEGEYCRVRVTSNSIVTIY